MPRLTPERPAEVIRKLRRLGFDGPFGGGRHVFMRHPESRVKIPVPFHGGEEIRVPLLRKIMGEAGVTEVDAWLLL